MSSFVPPLILTGNPIWHNQNALLDVQVYMSGSSPLKGRDCVFIHLYSQGLAHLLEYSGYYTFIRRVSKRGVKMNPSDLFSSSLILFLVMSHLLFNPSLEIFILIIMFSFLKYLYGFSSGFYVFKYFTVILYSVPNNSRISSSLGSKSTGD